MPAARAKDEITLPHPRANPELLGHEAAERQLRAAIDAERLPHAWLITGPRGIGKATLAYRAARFLLSRDTEPIQEGLFGDPTTDLAVAQESGTFRRVAAAGHADLIALERVLDAQGKRLRGEIVVDQVRALSRAFTLTSAEGGWRVGILDSADEMNVNAANALLKLLEEPPPRSLLILVAHAPGRLLATIRSRCRHLPLQALPEDTVAGLLARHIPDMSEADCIALARLSEGSPGRALSLAGTGGLTIYRDLLALLAGLPSVDHAEIHRLADRLARADQEPAYRAWIDLLILWLVRLVRTGAGRGGAVEPEEGALAQRLLARDGLDRWIDLWEKISRLAARADSVHLDRRLVVMHALLSLEETARQ